MRTSSSSTTGADFAVVSFATFPGPYQHELKRLVASLERVGLTYHVFDVPDEGSWEANTAAKACVLRHCRAHLDVPILYVDADAVFHRDGRELWTVLRMEEVDVAMRWRKDRFLTGTMWLGTGKRVTWLLDEWVAYNDQRKAIGETSGAGQATLNEVMRRPAHSALKVLQLDPSYCWIFDEEPKRPTGIVIEHLQASREYRRGGGASEEQIERRRARVAELETST